jgi:transcriptional regulator with XRE-family HTH domain
MEKPQRQDFGSFLRRLRQEKGYSLKGLANKINLNYTYISKLENGHNGPSDKFIETVSVLFDYDKEELMVRAGKIPDDVLSLISDNPKEAIKFLRKKFGD